MNPAYVYVIAAVLLGAAGTFCQAYGSAKADNETSSKGRRRRMLLAIGPLLTVFSVYLLWTGQQRLSQQAAAKPVFEAFVDREKILHIRNLGTIDLDDIRVDLTTYVLKAVPLPEGGGHVSIRGIESFARSSKPICIGVSIPKDGGAFSLDLATTPFAPIHDGIPDLNTEAGRTVHALRILCRNAVTKQRLLRYLITGAFKRFPDVYGDYRDTGIGGGYESSEAVFSIRQLIRSHQLELFDDDPSIMYHD
jgi:hypothetical protein